MTLVLKSPPLYVNKRCQDQAIRRRRLMTCQVESGVIDRSWRAVQSAAERDARDWGNSMFGLGDLFQWERFVTPTVIKVFYWLAVVIAILLGLSGVVSALTTMAYNPFAGVIFLVISVLAACMGVIMSRIAAEFVLIVFRINEHLGAIRNQGGFRNQ